MISHPPPPGSLSRYGEVTFPLTVLRRLQLGAQSSEGGRFIGAGDVARRGIDIDVEEVGGRICVADFATRSRRFRVARQRTEAPPRPLSSILADAEPGDIVCIRPGDSIASNDPRLLVGDTSLWIVCDAIPESGKLPSTTVLVRHRRRDTATTPEREFAALRAAAVDGVVMAVRDWNRATVSMAHRFGLIAVAENAKRAEHVIDATVQRLDAVSWEGPDSELGRLAPRTSPEQSSSGASETADIAERPQFQFGRPDDEIDVDGAEAP